MLRGALALVLLALLAAWPAIGAADDGPKGKAGEPDWRLKLLPRRMLAQPAERQAIGNPAALRDTLSKAGFTLAGDAHTVVDARDVGRTRQVHSQVQQEVVYDIQGLPKAVPGIVWIQQPASLVMECTSKSDFARRLRGDPSAARRAIRALDLDSTGRVEVTAGDPRDTVMVQRVFVRATRLKDVGIYTDRGAHRNAVRTAAAACLAAGLSVRPLTAAEINAGSFRRRVRTLLVPGGWAEPYTQDIDAKGTAHIREFIDKGGGYVGICAGAFYACATIRWDGTEIDYPLDLVGAKGVGPIEAIAPWPKHALAALEVDTKHPLAKGMPAARQAFYLGGCALEPARRSKFKPKVVARYAEGDGAAIVTYERRKGRIFLTGVHLEYDLTSEADDLVWPENEGKLKDPESDWDLFQRGVRWTLGR